MGLSLKRGGGVFGNLGFRLRFGVIIRIRVGIRVRVRVKVGDRVWG